MAAKKNSSTNKKEGNITRPERVSVKDQAQSALNNAKEKTGKVIQVAISDRTSIELPAHLSKEEIDARVAKYIKIHKSKI